MKINLKVIPTNKPADVITPILDVSAILPQDQATEMGSISIDYDTLTVEEKAKVDAFISFVKDKTAK